MPIFWSINILIKNLFLLHKINIFLIIKYFLNVKFIEIFYHYILNIFSIKKIKPNNKYEI